jgi:predicted DNA-binding WGR domain protein
MSLDAARPAQDTDGMTESTPIHLTRIDLAQNMARFYEISLQPTLFGEASLWRNWGRIGTRGQAMIVTYPDRQDAALAMAKLTRQKQRRGYQ